MASKRFAHHPLEGTCPLCDEPLADKRLVKRKRVWVHRACVQREQQ